MFLMRLMMLPFGLVNYMLGVTSLSFPSFICGTLAYILKTCLYTFIGCSLYTLSIAGSKDTSNETNIMIVELIFTLLVTIFISWNAKNIFNNSVNDQRRRNSDSVVLQ